MNKALIARRTAELAAALQIADQLEGMSVREMLVNISIRFARIGKKDAAAQCLAMADRA